MLRVGLIQALGLMTNLLANAETDLGRAGWLLLLEIAGTVALGLILGNLGFATDSVILVAWLFNLWPTWYICRAAKRMGKSVLLFGAMSLLGGAVAAWAWLHSQDQWRLLERKYSGPSDEA